MTVADDSAAAAPLPGVPGDHGRSASGEAAAAPAAQSQLSRRRMAAYVIVLGAMTALSPLTVGMYTPAFPILQAEFDATALAIQFTMTGSTIGFALGQLAVGPFSDRVGRRLPLVLSAAVHCVASVLVAMAPNLGAFYAARFTLGISGAAGAITTLAIARDLFRGKRLVAMLSKLAIVSGVAPVIAPSLGALLLPLVTWRGIFLVIAGYAFTALAATVLIKETLPLARRARRGGAVAAGYRRLFADRVFIGAALVSAANGAANVAFVSSSSFLLQQTYHLTAAEYGGLFAVFSVSSILGVQLAAQFVRRGVDPRRVIAVTTGVMPVAGTLMLLATPLGLGLGAVVGAVVVMMMLGGMASPCISMIALEHHGEAAGTAASVLGGGATLVAAVVAPTVGILAGTGVVTATHVGAVVLAAALGGLVAAWVVLRRAPHDRHAE